jgi:tRNA threonylcarbamoyladenosine biosynthesis protein TsaE
MSIFTELAAGVVARDEAETRAIAARLAARLPVDQAVALSGDLGAGKTTFVKGLAAAWGVREAVTSPSFTLCNLHRGSRLLVHVDAYRLASAEGWDGLMIEDFLVSPWCLAVEWPERVTNRLPADLLWLRFEIGSDGARTIQSTRPAV